MLTFYNHTNSEVIAIFIHDGVKCYTLPLDYTDVSNLPTNHYVCFLLICMNDIIQMSNFKEVDIVICQPVEHHVDRTK